VIARVTVQPLASQKKLIAAVKSSSADTIRIGFQKLPAKWFRELMVLDPPAIFGQVTQPVLIIGGEKDLQCDPADVERIAKLVRGPVEAHTINNLTHVLRYDEGEPSILGTAELIKRPMEPVVVELVNDWLKKQCAR
jgi:pimeloyl-ACP methyl ester carboxylesterase